MLFLFKCVCCRNVYRFRFGNFRVKDPPGSCRSNTNRDGEMIAKFEQDGHVNNNRISKELNMGHQTVSDHLRKAEMGCRTN